MDKIIETEKKIPETLFELLDMYKIEIPIVQRDYAQGRQDEQSNFVRSKFLEDMKSAILRETEPLDINFVYGKTEECEKPIENKFIPIDGQQRLTTLFLLHVYAFYNDESKTALLKKFTYETRLSSRIFLEKLTEKRRDVFAFSLSPSKEIEDSEWFLSGWKYDPTIKSALTMLDDIKKFFGNVTDLAQRLLDEETKPIIFKFLNMNDLGMEDSLYIKLNARGKPLTPFENFKARLIGQLKRLELKSLTKEFETLFDGKWTDLFWSRNKTKFDQIYLTFFGVLLMNKRIIPNDNSGWSNKLDYEKVTAEIFETVYYTLNFLSDNKENIEAKRFIFDALTEKPTYPNRVLFHAITSYMYLSKGTDTGSLRQWIRIIKNLTLNTTIDSPDTYKRSIDGLNNLAYNWNNLLEYFSKYGKVSGFSSDQTEEEQRKARIILQNNDFAKEIYKAELHPYFSGQIRSALYYAINNEEKSDIETFTQYWNKISALFDDDKPKHGHLLRQALLTIGDYTLRVGGYRTLCIDNPNEDTSTPSMKRLFSEHEEIVKKLLDTLDLKEDTGKQLKDIVNNSKVQKDDWRYCFIEFDNLFNWMSPSHLRLLEVNGELLIIPNVSSRGYNYDVFLAALQEKLNSKGIAAWIKSDLGMYADRYLSINEKYKVKFKGKKYIIKDIADKILFETTTDDPILEASKYLQNI